MNKTNSLESAFVTKPEELYSYRDRKGKDGIVDNLNMDLENESFESFKKRCLKIITNLKEELKKEKLKYHKSYIEISHAAMEQKQLEKIFIDCVELVQSDIKHRRELELLSLKQTESSKAKHDYLAEIPGYEHFLAQDKRNLILNFFLSNEIINFIHDALFVPQTNLNSTMSSLNERTIKGSLTQKTIFQKQGGNLISNTQYSKNPPTGLSHNISSKIKTKGLS